MKAEGEYKDYRTVQTTANNFYYYNKFVMLPVRWVDKDIVIKFNVINESERIIICGLDVLKTRDTELIRYKHTMVCKVMDENSNEDRYVSMPLSRSGLSELYIVRRSENLDESKLKEKNTWKAKTLYLKLKEDHIRKGICGHAVENEENDCEIYDIE